MILDFICTVAQSQHLKVMFFFFFLFETNQSLLYTNQINKTLVFGHIFNLFYIFLL